MTSGANFGSARSLVKSVSLVFSYALPDIHGRHLGLGKDAGRYRCRRAARSDRSGMLPQFIDEDPRVLAVGAAQRFDDVEVFFAWNAKDLLDTLILKGGDEQLGAFHGLQSFLGGADEEFSADAILDASFTMPTGSSSLARACANGV